LNSEKDGAVSKEAAGFVAAAGLRPGCK